VGPGGSNPEPADQKEAVTRLTEPLPATTTTRPEAPAHRDNTRRRGFVSRLVSRRQSRAAGGANRPATSGCELTCTCWRARPQLHPCRVMRVLDRAASLDTGATTRRRSASRLSGCGHRERHGMANFDITQANVAVRACRSRRRPHVPNPLRRFAIGDPAPSASAKTAHSTCTSSTGPRTGQGVQPATRAGRPVQSDTAAVLPRGHRVRQHLGAPDGPQELLIAPSRQSRLSSTKAQRLDQNLRQPRMRAVA
jgi:hypothetical protein